MSQEPENNIPWLELAQFLQRGGEVGKAQRKNLEVILGKKISYAQKIIALKFLNFRKFSFAVLIR